MSAASTSSACHTIRQEEESASADRANSLGEVDPALSAPVGDEGVDGRDVSGSEVVGPATGFQSRLPQYPCAEGSRLLLQCSHVADHLPLGMPYCGLCQVSSQYVEGV